MMKVELDHVIDLERYPLDQQGSAAHIELIANLQAQIDAVGCAVLRKFIRASKLPLFIAEADRVAEKGHRSFNRTNAYFSKDDPALTPSHPVRRFYDRSNAFVPADNFGSDSPLRSLYEWPLLMPFIQTVLDQTHFHRYADPLADVIINTVEQGDGFPWHFDTNNFTVTLALQNGDSGGVFEYAPNIRTPQQENYGRVQAILDGDDREVHRLHLEPGDLQIFKGRYSLHRVSPVQGARRRYVGIFSFVEQPGMVAKVERAQQLYGKALPIHYERENQRQDLLKD